MIKISRSFIAALLLSGAVVTAGGPALAAEEKAAAGPKLSPSKAVAPLYQEAAKAIAAKDFPTALTKIQAADAVSSKPDDKYAIGTLKIVVGQNTNDRKLLAEGLQQQLESGLTTPADTIKYTRYLAQLAYENKDYTTAINQFEKLTVLQPGDAEVLFSLGELYRVSKSLAKALDYYDRAIAAKTAAGTKPEEEWYRRPLQVAYDAKLPQLQPAMMALVKNYPSATNWRDVLLITRETGKLDDQTNLDFMRLQAAAGALNGERDYAEYAQTALDKGLPGEAKAVIDLGIGKGMLSTTKPFVAELSRTAAGKIANDKAALPGLEKESRANPKTALATADAYYGYGDYAKAAQLYKLAGASAAVDPDTANLRLGAALARSGDKAGATAAFQLVKGGARATLAQYWLIWVGQAA